MLTGYEESNLHLWVQMLVYCGQPVYRRLAGLGIDPRGQDSLLVFIEGL